MSADTTITLVGNLTADPDLRFTASGVAVAGFTVASTPRTFDRQSGEWKDADTLFLRCTPVATRREHRRNPHQRHQGHRHRPAEATHLRHPRRPDAHRHRNRRRRHRPFPPLRHRTDHPHPQNHQRRCRRGRPTPDLTHTAPAARPLCRPGGRGSVVPYRRAGHRIEPAPGWGSRWVHCDVRFVRCGAGHAVTLEGSPM